MKEFSYVITDPEGVHARPAGILVKEAGKFTSSIKLVKNGKAVDAKKIFGVMGLAAKQGETLQIIAEGADEDAAIEALRGLMSTNL